MATQQTGMIILYLELLMEPVVYTSLSKISELSF